MTADGFYQVPVDLDRLDQALLRINLDRDNRYMAREDLAGLSQDVLVALILEQQRQLERLEAKVAGIQEVNGLWDGS